MVIGYLKSSGPSDPKHQTLSHSIISYIFSILALSLILLSMSHSSFYPSPKQLLLFSILLLYTCILFFSRFPSESTIQIGQITIYDMFWQCNISLVLALIGALLGNREIVSAAVVSVALDQSLWWVDIGSYIVSQKFHVGVAKYLIWPETTWSRVVTATHHLWFIPISAYLNEGLPDSGIYLGIVIVAYMALISRWCIPFEIPYHGKMRYMNINCTYECWKDVKIGVLHLADRKWYLDKHFFYGFCLLNFCWNVGNTMCFYLIKFLLMIE